MGRLRGAGLIATRRIGRETVCSVKPEAFAAFAARQRAVLGLAELIDGEALEDSRHSTPVAGTARSAAS